SIFALRAGLVDFVKASITGSIIGNLLLVFGLAAFLGGRRHGVQRFDARAAGMHAAQLVLATIGLLVPALFAHLVLSPSSGVAAARPEIAIEDVTLGVAVVLLATYVLAVVYDLQRPTAVRPHVTKDAWRRPFVKLAIAAGLLTWMSEVLVDSVQPVI